MVVLERQGRYEIVHASVSLTLIARLLLMKRFLRLAAASTAILAANLSSPPHAAEAVAPNAVCRSIEATIRENKGYVGDIEAQGLVEHMAHSGVIALGRQASLPDDIQTLLQRDPEGQELLDDYPGGFQLLEFGPDMPIFAVESVAGTAYCQRLWFYRRLQGGGVEAVARPSSPVGGCSPNFARMGVIGKLPVIFDEAYRDSDTKLAIVGRQNDSWVPICHIAARYKVQFEIVTERCAGENCAEFKRRLPDWLAEARKAEEGKPVTSDTGLVALQALKDINSRYRFVPPDDPRISWRAQYLWDSPVYGFSVANKSYRVRMSRLDLYSTVSPDEYVAGVFDESSGSPVQIGGYVLKARRESLDSLTVE